MKKEAELKEEIQKNIEKEMQQLFDQKFQKLEEHLRTKEDHILKL